MKMILMVVFTLTLFFHISLEEISGNGPDKNDRTISSEGDFEASFEGTDGVIDNSYEKVKMPRGGCRIDGKYYEHIYIHDNGRVTFYPDAYARYSLNIGISTTLGFFPGPMIAIFWTLVNSQRFRLGTSSVRYRCFVNPAYDPRGVFQEARTQGERILQKSFSPRWTCTVTWTDVKPPDDEGFDLVNKFQLLIASDDISSIAVIIFGNVEWSSKSLNNDGSSKASIEGASEPRVGYEFEHRYSDFRIEYDVLYLDEIDDVLANLGFGKFGIRLYSGSPSPESRCLHWHDRWLGSSFRCPRSCPPSYFWLLFFDRGFIFAPEFSSFWQWSFKEWSLRWGWGFGWGWNWEFGRGWRWSWRWGWNRAYETYCSYYSRWPYTLVRRLEVMGPSFGHTGEDRDAWSNCCANSRFCDLYYDIIRPCSSRGWFPRFSARARGDPHYITQDFKNYTLNGCGWFTYVQGEIPGNPSGQIEMQIRTTRVAGSNATAITGVAVKEGNSSTVQVNLNSTGELVILVNGSVEEKPPIGNRSVFQDGMVILSQETKELRITTPLESNIGISVAVNGTFLTLSTSIATEYKNSTKGLLGVWNDDPNDDFTLPNGTILSADLTEREIFYEFGEKWKVTDNERLYITIADDANFACPTNFVPIFLDEALADAEPALKAEAESVCGNDITCLFDILSTGNVAIGQETHAENEKIEKEVVVLNNHVPTFTTNLTEITVYLGEVFTLSLSATDDDNDPLEYTVTGIPAHANYTSDNNLIFIWSVNDTDEVELFFSVSDGKNGTATLNPTINLCACQNKETCISVNQTNTNETTLPFVILECDCPLGKTGRYCETQKDFCATEYGTICHPLVKCTNLPTSYQCEPCPSGYNGTGAACQDINECLTNNGGCEQSCTNNAGSFGCSCWSSYKLNDDQKTCRDIDECSQPNDCAQLCNNTIGSYDCYCNIGFKKDPNDAKKCLPAESCPEVLSQNCGQICYMDPLNPGKNKCACNLGYILNDDGRTCRDADECQSVETNLCGHNCENTNGSYNCSCEAGYLLTGQFSCTDIDECKTIPCTGAGQLCDNFPGGYRCICDTRNNLILVNGSCIFKTNDVTEDKPTDKPAGDTQQTNAVQVTIANFQSNDWTITVDDTFRQAVTDVLSSECNKNRFRPQDCGTSQNELYFGIDDIQRVPGYPQNSGNDIVLQFYVNYPNGTSSTSGSPVLQKSILASIIFAELAKLESKTQFTSIRLDTSVVPDPPKTPTAEEASNAALLEISNFDSQSWTTFFNSVFTRGVSAVLNKYCNTDEVTLSQCGFSGGSIASFNQSRVFRNTDYPAQEGNNTAVSFYVLHPDTSQPIAQRTLASILATEKEFLESTLNLQITLKTDYTPDPPSTPSSDQSTNSVTLSVSSFSPSKWTYLTDKRFREAVADRVKTFCSKDADTIVDCQIPSSQTTFSLSDVQLTRNLTQSGSDADVTFYVNYPGGSNPIVKNILASIIKDQLDAIQLSSGLSLTLSSSYAPDAPSSTPTTEQSNNLVELQFLNFQASEFTEIQNNRLKRKIAALLNAFCSENPINELICEITSGQTFSEADVIRHASSPKQSGSNSSYEFFIVPPSGSGSFNKNLGASILKANLSAIESFIGPQLLVTTSTAALTPPTADSTKTDEAVTLVARNVIASEWSVIQDRRFRAAVAFALSAYCNAVNQQSTCGITEQTTFTLSNVQRVQGSPSQNGSDAELTIYATYPNGEPIPKEILALILNVKLSTSIEHDAELQLDVVPISGDIIPPATQAQNESAISITIPNFFTSKWANNDIAFKQLLISQVIQYCNQSEETLQQCNMTRDELSQLEFSDIRHSAGYPKADGNDTQLSFYVNLPNGGVLSQSVLSHVFQSSKDTILPNLTTTLKAAPYKFENSRPNDEMEIKISFSNPSEVLPYYVDDIKKTIAQRLNQHCVDKTTQPCHKGNFSENDVHVTNATGGTEALVMFYVTYPGEANNAIPPDTLRNILSASFKDDSKSTVFQLSLSVDSTQVGTADRETDWPLILGVSLATALLLVLIVLAVVIVVTKSKSPTKYITTRDDQYSAFSSPQGSWQFHRDSPYAGSPFESIDAIPGFDEDGLPTEYPP